MDVSTLKQLGQLVYEYCGLNYLSNLSSLDMKVKKRLEELNITSYWKYINYLQSNEDEWDILIVVLTINETYFYREDKQLEEFSNIITEQLKTNTRPLNIWSAACSTGEEPFSLAMVLKDKNPSITNEVHILGTDINKKVLTIAKGGRYSKRSLSFRRIPNSWLDKYFNEIENYYEMKDDIRKMVSFDHLNLLDITTQSLTPTYDVIFCRNVLIYFDEKTIKDIVTSYYHLLNKGGYLFLGHAESITKFNIGFETINSNGTFYYRKR